MDMTADELTRAVVARGAPDAGVAAAADAVLGRLAPLSAADLVDGLAMAADPAAALHGLARLLDVGGGRLTPENVATLLRLLGGSAAIAATFVAEGGAWPALLDAVLTVPHRSAADHRAALPRGALPQAALQAELRRYRRRELARIGGRDLLALARVDDTLREITALAEAVVDTAVTCVRARLAAEWGDPRGDDGAPVPFVVLGMGKLGGRELNYSSDVDLVYLYAQDGELTSGRTFGEFFTRLGNETTRALGEVTSDGLCFRVDLRLRPGGGEGPVAVALPAALSYYETWGQTWERAVWLKARPVAGDAPLGESLIAELEPFVYRRYLDFGTIEDLKAMKRRVDDSLRDLEAARRDVKLGRGGIREVEFFVQAQQLVHGGKDGRLRVRGTLEALDALARAGYVDAALAARLADAYRFLRDVEHKVQIVQERQTHLIPNQVGEMLALARRVGFRGPDAVATFWRVHAEHTGAVRGAFDGLFHAAEERRRREEQPELTALVDDLEHEEDARRRLTSLGFRDVDRAYRELRLLRDGPLHARASARRRQALATLAPALLGEIARSAAPERALGHMATFISTVGARTSYLHLLLENPGVLRLLVRLFASSQFLATFFLRHPELLDSLVRADLVRILRPRDEMAAELEARLAATSDLETALDGLRRFRHEEFLRIGVHDIEGTLTPDEVAAQLTALAETTLTAALGIARREVLARTAAPPEPATESLVVLGMGKLGSADLDYASDLDLIFIYDPGTAGCWENPLPAHEFFTRIAQRTISALATPTREGIAYRIDTRLRPSGNQGPLVSPVAAFEAYHAESAQVWERQALIRARPVAGPPPLRDRLGAVVDRFVYGRGLEPGEAAEIGRMRERIARERGGDANIKTGRGGLVDVEFLVQMLQLRYGHEYPALRTRHTADAIAVLEGERLLAPNDAAALASGYAFLRAVASRLRLERDQPVEELDDAPEALLALARRLGYAGDDATAVTRLRADHARHRAAIRAVYDRQFENVTA